MIRRRRSGHRCRRIPAVSIRSPTFLRAAGMLNRIPQQMTITIRSRSIPASLGTGLFLYGTVRMSSRHLRQHSHRILRHGSAANRCMCSIRRSIQGHSAKSTMSRATGYPRITAMCHVPWTKRASLRGLFPVRMFCTYRNARRHTTG